VRFAGIDARNRLFVRLPGPIAFASGIRNFAEDESGIRREQRKSHVKRRIVKAFLFFFPLGGEPLRRFLFFACYRFYVQT